MINIRGKVIYGEQIGSRTGYPTANLHWRVLRNKKVKKGVYAVWAEMSGKIHQGLLVVGVPGVKKFKKGKVEIYLLDYKKKIYGHWLNISIIKFLRPIREFKKVSQLNIQVRKDIRRAKGFFFKINSN